MLFNVVGFMILARVLSKEELGIWALFLIFVTIVEVSKNGFIKNAIIKYLASSEKEEHPKIITASFFLNLFFTLFLIGVIVALSGAFSEVLKAPQISYMLKLYIITGLVFIPFSQFEFIQQGNFDFKGIFVSYFFKGLFFFSSQLFLFFFRPEVDILTYLVLAHASAYLFGAIVSYFYVKKYLVFSKSIDWKWISTLFGFGKYVLGTNISTQIIKSIDQLMLGSLLAPAAVASYNVALKANNFLETPTASITAIIYPQSAKRIKNEGPSSIKYLYERSVGAILAVLIPFLLIILLFPDTVILVIAGKDYADSVPILQITALYSIFVPFGRQFGTIFDSIGKPKITLVVLIITATINIISNYFFIMAFGVMGAAYGTLLTQVCGFIISQYVLRKELNVNVLNAFVYAKRFYVDACGIAKNYFTGLIRKYE